MVVTYRGIRFNKQPLSGSVVPITIGNVPRKCSFDSVESIVNHSCCRFSTELIKTRHHTVGLVPILRLQQNFIRKIVRRPKTFKFILKIEHLMEN
jgi:hypothetical protein